MGTKGSSLENEIKRKVDSGKTSLAILAVAFFFTIREVVETILFLIPFATIDILTTAAAAVSGLILAVLFSLFISSSIMKVDLKNFFYYSSLLLILIAGGLVGYGVHELLEYSKEMGFENFLHATAFDLKVDENSLIHHKNIIGSFFAVTFGYTVKAEVGRVVTHLLYLSIAFPIVFRVYAGRRLSMEWRKVLSVYSRKATNNIKN
jgi:high-affinity iron transporter